MNISKSTSSKKNAPQEYDSLFKIRVTNFTFTILLLVGLVAGGKYIEGPVSGNLSSAEMRVIVFAVTFLAYIRLKINFKIAEIKNEANGSSTKTIERNLSFLRLIIGVLAISLLAFLFVYNSELPSIIAYFFAIRFPQIADSATTIVSNVIASIISLTTGFFGDILLGVIGNLVYDVLKHFFLKARNK